MMHESHNSLTSFKFKACKLILKATETTGVKLTRADTHSLHVENRRLHKARAEVVNDEVGDTQGDAVLTQGAHDQHFLEFITVILPIT